MPAKIIKPANIMANDVCHYGMFAVSGGVVHYASINLSELYDIAHIAMGVLSAYS